MVKSGSKKPSKEPVPTSADSTRSKKKRARDAEPGFETPETKKRTRQATKSDSKPKRKLFSSDEGQEESTGNKNVKETEESPLFPDLSSKDAVSKTWTKPEIKTMMEHAGLKTAGTKEQLVDRMIQHAKFDNVSKVTAADESKLTDIQILSALQSRKLELSSFKTPEARRTYFKKVFRKRAAAEDVEDGEKNEDATSGDSEESEVPSESSGEEEESRQPQNKSAKKDSEQLTIASLVSKMDAQERKIMQLSKELKLKRRMAKQAAPSSSNDEDEDSGGVLSDSPSESEVDSTRERKKVKLASRDESDSKSASDICAAIVEGLSSMQSAADGSSSNNAVMAKLARTHPALVDPRDHGNDAHKFGLLTKRLLQFELNGDPLSAITWKRSCKAVAAEIHALVHAASSQEDYIEGEYKFTQLVTDTIGLAAEHEKDARKYGMLRTRQLSRWNEAFRELKDQIRQSSKYWRKSSQTRRLQLEDLITTALGLGMSNSQLRNLNTTAKLRANLYGSDEDDDEIAAGGRAHVSWERERNSPPESVTPGFSPPEKSKGKKPKSKEKKKAVTFSDPGHMKSSGERCPIAASIIGADTNGAEPVTTTCKTCGKGGSVEEGHSKFECPSQFAKDHPGKTLPGFDREGNKVPNMWSGPNITDETKRLWVRLQRQGYFTQPPFRNEPAKMPDLRP